MFFQCVLIWVFMYDKKILFFESLGLLSRMSNTGTHVISTYDKLFIKTKERPM